MITKKTWWISAFISICLFAGTYGAAHAASVMPVTIVGPVTISFQGAGPGEFDYSNFDVSGNSLSTSPAAIPAQITAVSPMNAWNTFLPTTTLPANINFGLSGDGQFNKASLSGNTFSQILNIGWGADFSNNSGDLSITGLSPLTISGSLNGTNATIAGSFNQMAFYQSGIPIPIGLSQPELLTINLNTTTPLTLDNIGMLNSFTGDWGGRSRSSNRRT